MAAKNTENEIKHEVTLFAEPILHVGSFTITNSLINSWVAIILLILFALLIRRKIREIPRGFQNFVEIVIEGALKMADTVTGSREKTLKVFPLVFSLFLFILLNNYLGLIPGVGSIGFIERGEEGLVFVPLFRGATADLNTTLALSIFAVLATHALGVITIGGWHHVNKFFNFSALSEIPKKILKEPTIILVNPIKAFVGIVEFIGEFAKTASLSLRLFGNIFAGEVLLTAIAGIFAYAVPIPFMFLELIVGVVQALVFAMLTLVFASIAMTAEEH